LSTTITYGMHNLGRLRVQNSHRNMAHQSPTFCEAALPMTVFGPCARRSFSSWNRASRGEIDYSPPCSRRGPSDGKICRYGRHFLQASAKNSAIERSLTHLHMVLFQISFLPSSPLLNKRPLTHYVTMRAKLPIFLTTVLGRCCQAGKNAREHHWHEHCFFKKQNKSFCDAIRTRNGL